MSEWKAVVLAAGRSSRMGVPKPLLRLDGSNTTLLCDKIRQLQSLGASEVAVVAGYHEARVRQVTEVCPGAGLSFVRNPAPGQGQTKSVKVGLEKIGVETPTLLLPVDQPPLADEILEAIVSRRSGSGIVIPSCDRSRGHPPLLPGWFLEEIRNMPVGAGINSLYEQYDSRITHLSFDDRTVLADLDRPGQLRRYRGAAT